MKTKINSLKGALCAGAALLGLALTITPSSATTILDPTGPGGFEGGVDFPTNGWTLVSGR